MNKILENEKKQNNNTVLNENVLTKGKFHGKSYRNIAESIVFAGIVAYIILRINFTELVTNMSLLILCPLVMYLCIKGIKNRSVTEIIQAEIKHRFKRRRLHLRGPEYVRKESKYAKEQTNESLVESVWNKIREKAEIFIAEYANDDDEKDS